jgi:hypothetical protein
MLAGLLMAKLGAVAGMLWRPSATMPGGITGWLVYLVAHGVLNRRAGRKSRAHHGRATDDWTAPTLRPGTTKAQPHRPLPSTTVLLSGVFATLLLAVILSDVIGIAL